MGDTATVFERLSVPTTAVIGAHNPRTRSRARKLLVAGLKVTLITPAPGARVGPLVGAGMVSFKNIF